MKYSMFIDNSPGRSHFTDFHWAWCWAWGCNPSPIGQPVLHREHLRIAHKPGGDGFSSGYPINLKKHAIETPWCFGFCFYLPFWVAPLSGTQFQQVEQGLAARPDLKATLWFFRSSCCISWVVYTRSSLPYPEASDGVKYPTSLGIRKLF